MPEYSICLDTESIYYEGEAPYVYIYTHGRFGYASLIDERGDTPHDSITLIDSEVETLVDVLTAYLNRDGDGTLGRIPSNDGDGDQSRTDTDGAE